MRKIREIIRLYCEGKSSNRQISRSLNISRPVVAQYIINFKNSGLTYENIEAMNDESLLEILELKQKEKSQRYRVLSAMFENYAKELMRTGVNLYTLWEEYRKEHEDGYSYSQFCYHYQIWRNGSELSMHIEHKAGDKMYVDFTGKKLKIIDRATMKERDVEVFVAILGASQYTYVEGVMDQSKENWIRANENALLYFGGVTQAIVPDNLKSAVTKADKYEPDINPEYYDFARHYATVILPARAYQPKDKALVEGAVNIVYSWIFAKLRDMVFYSLDELNQAIKAWLERYNDRLMQRLKISRRELFNQTEKDALKPLPAVRYEMKNFCRMKVQFCYHIYLSVDKHYYSVPYKYRGKTVDIIFSDLNIEIYCENTRIAFHKRQRTKNGYSTITEHMPPNHKWISEWNPERFINWAEKIGSNTKAVIIKVLETKEHPEQGFKVCLGILNLEKKYSGSRLDRACHRALVYNNFSLKSIKNILEYRLEDQQDLFPEDELSYSISAHENIRGSQYYN